jgi:leader peptidase (prepilin peptidase)/N-methyltransferase
VTVALIATAAERVPTASGVAVAVLVIAAVVDAAVRRLPNSVVLAAGSLFLAVLGVDIFRGTPINALSVVAGIAAMAGPMLALHLVSPSAMGFGDVKAGVVLGAALGAVDASLALVALAAASGVTAIVGLVARRRTLPFGPGLVAMSAVALAAHSWILPQFEGASRQPTAVELSGRPVT